MLVTIKLREGVETGNKRETKKEKEVSQEKFRIKLCNLKFTFFKNYYHISIHCVKSFSSPNTQKDGPEKTPYLDTFHAVIFDFVGANQSNCLSLILLSLNFISIVFA